MASACGLSLAPGLAAHKHGGPPAAAAELLGTEGVGTSTCTSGAASSAAAPAAIPFTRHAGLRFYAAGKATVRSGAELGSKRCGRVRVGEVVTVLESRDDIRLQRPGSTALVRRSGTTTRLRFDAGWVSLTARDGSPLFKMVGAAASSDEARTLVQNPMMEVTPTKGKTVVRVFIQRTGSAVLRERAAAIENIFGDEADSPPGTRPASKGAAQYKTNPKFAGQANAPGADQREEDDRDDEAVMVEQLRRRLSRLSTTEIGEDTPARRERLPSLNLGRSVSRPLGQTNSVPDLPSADATREAAEAAGAAAEALISKHVSDSVSRITAESPAVQAVCTAARAFLLGPGGTQLRQCAMKLAMQPTARTITAAESSAVTIAALAELRAIALSVLSQAVAQVSDAAATPKAGAKEGLVSKITPRKRKRAATAATSDEAADDANAVQLSEAEEMQVVDEILFVLVPDGGSDFLFESLKRSSPNLTDAVWSRAARRFVQAETSLPEVDLSAVVQELGEMSAHVHAPGRMLGVLLSSVKMLYGVANDGVSADELLPLFIAAVARCEDANLAALQRFVEELGCFSPCGEAARYLTDLCAAVTHILAEDGRALVAEWLTAHDLAADEVERFLEEGYSGEACVRELETLNPEQLNALVDEVTGALE